MMHPDCPLQFLERPCAVATVCKINVKEKTQ